MLPPYWSSNAKYDHFRYAGTVMEVCKVNEELNRQLEEVVHCFILVTFVLLNIFKDNIHCLQVAGFTAKFGDSPGPSLSLPDQIKENCQEEGYDMVSDFSISKMAYCNIVVIHHDFIDLHGVLLLSLTVFNHQHT